MNASNKARLYGGWGAVSSMDVGPVVTAEPFRSTAVPSAIRATAPRP